MQAKAARDGLRSTEVPVSYHCRIGKSKITGTVKGTVAAGYKILTTIVRVRVEPGREPAGSSRPSRPSRKVQKVHA
jgi:hypothetical protein